MSIYDVVMHMYMYSSSSSSTCSIHGVLLHVCDTVVIVFSFYKYLDFLRGKIIRVI